MILMIMNHDSGDDDFDFDFDDDDDEDDSGDRGDDVSRRLVAAVLSSTSVWDKPNENSKKW